MGAFDDQITALLEAARQAADIGSYLTSFPGDKSVQDLLRAAASTISETAQTIEHQELLKLSASLDFTANGIISTKRGVEKLNRLVYGILAIAEALAEPT